MSLVCRPQREDHFPATKRGFTANAAKVARDQNANIRDWCDERGLSVKTKERPRARYHTPVEALYAATGGR